MAAPPTKPGKYCMLDPSPIMGTFNTARSNQVSMTLPRVYTYPYMGTKTESISS